MHVEEVLLFTKLLNYLFARPVTALLAMLGIHVEHPDAPIPNYIAMQVLVALIMVVLFLVLRARLSMERPGKLQHMFEVFVGFIQEQAHEVIGHNGHRFVPMVLTLGFFILFCNLIGLIPAFISPTAHPEVTLGCAMVAFLYYHVSGIRQQGIVHYIKHFMGPVLPLAPIMLPIEAVSHLGRPLSLSVRLYANIFAGDLVFLIFFSLVPLAIPIVFLGLHLFVAFLQSYIFMLLTMIYLAGAVEEAH